MLSKLNLPAIGERKIPKTNGSQDVYTKHPETGQKVKIGQIDRSTVYKAFQKLDKTSIEALAWTQYVTYCRNAVASENAIIPESKLQEQLAKAEKRAARLRARLGK